MKRFIEGEDRGQGTLLPEHLDDYVTENNPVTPDAMRIRRSTVEHPYATIKAWMGSTHFLTKGLERVKAEMSLHVLAYNFSRLLTLLGMQGTLAAIRAYARFLPQTGLFGALSLLVLQSTRKQIGHDRSASICSWIYREPYNLAYESGS